MNIHILGAGSMVNGMPGIPDQYPPGFILEFKDTPPILLECSEAIRFRVQQAGFEYTSLEHIMLSHTHPDHMALVQFIQSVYVKGLRDKTFRRDTLHIYGPKHLTENFRAYWNYHHEYHYNKDYEFPSLKFITMKDGDSCTIGETSITARKMHHGFGKVSIRAYRYETPDGIFVYSGENGDPKNYAGFTDNADIFLSEASAPVGSTGHHEYGHMTPYDTGIAAKVGNVKKLVLFHYSGIDSAAVMIADAKRSGYAGEIIVAKDFDVISM
jgi:ribonuclease BN (tRNA processing enzyme)